MVSERTQVLSIALVLVLVYSWVGILLRLRCGHNLGDTVVMIQLQLLEFSPLLFLLMDRQYLILELMWVLDHIQAVLKLE